jgi:hypothetical protein
MYGSSVGRALYGQGDYQSRSGYAGGYYAAGGFFSGLKKLAGGAVNLAASKGIGGALFRSGLSLVPGAGTALQVAGAARSSGLFRKVAGIAAPALTRFGPGGRLVAGVVGSGLALENATRRKRGAGGRKRRSGGTTLSTSRSRRRPTKRTRRTSKRRRGDWGDDGGRDKRGHFLNERGGHANFRKRRRRGRAGQRVSFTTKSGRRVSFTARGDAS